MSKRHNTSRRRTYGRRQHELHERVERRQDRRAERAWRVTPDGMLEPLPYMEGPAADPLHGFAD